MVFSAPVHQDPLLIIDIVDDAWAADTLPVEDVVVSPAEITNLEDDEPSAQPEEEDDDKWTDLTLDEFASRTSLRRQSTSKVPPSTTPRRTQCR